MSKDFEAMIHLLNKSVRIISFKKKQAYTVIARKKAISIHEFVDLADSTVHEDFGGIVKNLINFSEYEWSQIQKDRHDEKNDFILLHDEFNTQLIDTNDTCVWKRVE